MDDFTPFILRLIMVVYLTVGLGILLSPNYYRKIFAHLLDNKLMIYLGGLMALVVGFAVITYHNVWQGWGLLVTLLGWAAFLKGLMVLLLPEQLMKISTQVMKESHFFMYGLSAIILGLIFGYFGFLA